MIKNRILRAWLAVMFFALAGVGQAQTAADEIFVVQASDRQPTVSISGTVVPYKQVTLAAQLPGRIKYIAGIEGDFFKEGTLLVAIDDAELLATLNHEDFEEDFSTLLGLILARQHRRDRVSSPSS